MKYNKTQLNPDKEFSRHIFHRDQFAHYLRWCHIMKIAKIGMNILDIGCGTGNLLELFYRNRYKPNKYIGIDVNKNFISIAKERFNNLDYAKFIQLDLVKEDITMINEYQLIVCFEVLEHIGKHNVQKFIDNIKSYGNRSTIFLFSTPVFNGKAAANHTIDGDPQELTFTEMQNLMLKNFDIIEKYGTFASMSDYKHKMNEWQKKMYNRLYEYYDTNLISVLMAPMFPCQSRNILWKVKLK